MLIASTPEGARDFVVPSRLSPGEFYALPQSPQLFKQLLMVGGVDRYYQIARCLRDEDLRADRQFEFMQLDAEMSFADADDVMGVIGEAVLAAAEAVTGHATGRRCRAMTWHEAKERYGSDKPDVRFGLELVDLVRGVRGHRVPCLPGRRGEGRSGCPGEGDDVARAGSTSWSTGPSSSGPAGWCGCACVDGGDARVAGAKFLSEAEQLGIVDTLGARAGRPAAGRRGAAAHRRPRARHAAPRAGPAPGARGRPASSCGSSTSRCSRRSTTTAAPSPRTTRSPCPTPTTSSCWSTARGEDLLAVRSLAYDLVLNGWELGSGSVRIHRPDIQQRIFALLGISDEEAQARFGFLLDAFRYGAPPHAGFAFGIDRLVAILAGEDNIREVIAFPKTQSGSDPLTGAPTAIDPTQLEELGLSVLPRPKK